MEPSDTKTFEELYNENKGNFSFRKMLQRAERLNETREMNCGLKATIIEYRNSLDIDVQFEDGTIVRNVRYGSFKAGNIGNSSDYSSRYINEHNKRLGASKIMNCGQKATIIEYRNSSDIDVQFEDGTVVKNKSYGSFIKGILQNPAIKNAGDSRLGESRVMNNGEKATIVTYRKSDDIDVEFEDGTIVEHRTYSAFKLGNIRNPEHYPVKINRVGESRVMKNGMTATIIEYRSYSDLDVQYEDGTVIINQTYHRFKNGDIRSKNRLSSKLYIGQSNKMSCGLHASIIGFRNANDLDVQFDDGTVVNNQTYFSFENGYIKHPDITSICNKESNLERLGETRTMNCGEEARIIAYRSFTDIDVKFEDGTVVSHKQYSSFVKGSIRNPNVKIKKEIKEQDTRLGDSELMNCGDTATIICYRDSSDIDVQFTDGAVVSHRTYSAFKKGAIQNPNLKIKRHYTKKTPFQKRLGETRVMNNGEKAEIIEWRAYSDIDIMFEDGTVVKNRTYGNFKKGSILKKGIERIGETRKMNNGENATLIVWRSHDDIDVEFEDGKIVQHKKYDSFKKGKIGKYSSEEIKKNRTGISRIMTCGQNATIIEYRNSIDIDVQFDDGTVVTNTYSNFKKGAICHPKITEKRHNPNNVHVDKTIKDRLGETRIMKSGLSATIIAYRSSSDIDVQFKGGSIKKGVRYFDFINGKLSDKEAKSQLIVGESRKMNCGQTATIITYRLRNDIDVMFEDGTVVKNRTYNEFKMGAIRNPNILKNLRIGETRMMNCGQKATIINYINSENIDVEFEDGTVVKGRHYYNFKDGRIANPNLKTNKKKGRDN